MLKQFAMRRGGVFGCVCQEVCTCILYTYICTGVGILSDMSDVLISSKFEMLARHVQSV